MARRNRRFAARSAMFGLHHGRHRAYDCWFDGSAKARHKVLSMRCPCRQEPGVDLTLIFEYGGRKTLTAPVEQTLPTARRN